MITYTSLSILAVILVIIIDFIAGTKLCKKKLFWNFWAILVVLLFIVNGYLTWRPIVMYNSNFITNFRLFTIPIEDFLYGFSLVTLNLIIWEKLTKPLSEK
jgi:lycopene cyclase domain-containing protein